MVTLTFDPIINRVLPLPQGNHVAKFGKDPIYRTKVIVRKPVWTPAIPNHIIRPISRRCIKSKREYEEIRDRKSLEIWKKDLTWLKYGIGSLIIKKYFNEHNAYFNLNCNLNCNLKSISILMRVW